MDLFQRGVDIFSNDPQQLARFVREGLPLAEQNERRELLFLLDRLGAVGIIEPSKLVPRPIVLICPNCKKQYNKSEVICEQCGLEEKGHYISNDTLPPRFSYKGTPSGITLDKPKGGYSRLQFFREHVHEFTAHITREISPDVYAMVYNDCKKRGITKVNRKIVRASLKRCGRPDQYKNDIAIAGAFNNIPPPTFTDQQKSIMDEMFIQTEEWFKQCPQEIKQRESIIGYNYLIYKYCELHGWTDMLPLVKLPLDDTVRNYDKIWYWITQNRTQQPAWEYFDTIRV